MELYLVYNKSDRTGGIPQSKEDAMNKYDSLTRQGATMEIYKLVPMEVVSTLVLAKEPKVRTGNYVVKDVCPNCTYYNRKAHSTYKCHVAGSCPATEPGFKKLSFIPGKVKES